MLKICYLINTLNTDSGWGRYSYEVVHRMNRKKDIQITVLTEEPTDYAYVKAILYNSFKNLFSIFYNSIIIRKYIKNCDIIHCLDAYPYSVIAAIANIGLKKKIVISGIGTYSVAPLYHPIKKILLRWAYKKADWITCISSYTKNAILKKIKIDNISVDYMGIDYNKFQTEEIELKKTAEKKIISVGALKRRKGYHISIPAFGLVKKKYPDLKYYIIGDQSNQSYFKYLKELVDQYNLKKNVIFLSGIDDDKLIKLYYQSDLFLLVSINIDNHFEGFGLVFLEAGACGKPVIGTSGCGIEDAIDHNKTGLLVSQNNIKATANAIFKILTDVELADKLGRLGREKAKKMNWQTTIEKYLTIYEKISRIKS